MTRWNGGDNVKKMTILAVALIAICFVSGGYALYNNVVNDVADIPSSNSAIADPANPKIDSTSNTENPITTDISNKLESVSKVLEYFADYSAVIPTHEIFIYPDFNLTGYSVSNSDYYSFYVPEGYDTTDKFAQCAECGKYFSYGAVTKALPDYAICRGHDDCLGSVYDPNNPNVLSYDEVMFYLEHEKAPESVFNRVYSTYGSFGSYDSYSDYLAGITKEPNEPIHTMNMPEGWVNVPIDYQQYQELNNENIGGDNAESSSGGVAQNVIYY